MKQFRERMLGGIGWGGLGFVFGAVVGGGFGLLLAMLSVLPGTVAWYRVQPADWWIVTVPSAVLFVLLASAAYSLLGALVLGLLAGGASALVSVLRTRAKR